LVSYVRKRLQRQVFIAGQPEMIEAAKHVFDANVLTLGFARRFVPYKRPTLLLHDEDRFMRMLINDEKPVQLVIAGKAPPYDEEGKALIKEWTQFIQRHNLYNRVAFLSDYDMLLTENMVQGVDVWINTPRRPWEACGTSGMKVLVNGGINVSELDGWWADAYIPEAGWALGDMQEHGNDPGWDAHEAEALYNILEQQVIPTFYERNANGIPVKWIEKMRNSMAKLTPKFSANRTVREYTEKYYLPAAEKYLHRANDKGVIGKRIVDDTNELSSKWNGVHFNDVKTESIENGFICTTNIFLNGIDRNKILVELYADGKNTETPERIIMHQHSLNNDQNFYKAEVSTTRPENDYTIRIIPNYENIAVPLENNLILWQC